MKIFVLVVLLCFSLSCTSKSKKAVAEKTLLSMEKLDIKIGSAGTPEQMAGPIMQLKTTDPAPELLSLLEQEPLFKLSKPVEELLLVKNEKDELGFQHLTYGRVHKGIEIWGDEIKFHINDKNELYRMDGVYQPSLPDNFSTAPKLTKKEAEESAKQKLALAFVHQDETKLFIFPSDSGYKNAWRVIVAKARLAPDQWECLVDAESGDILFKSNLLRTN